MTSTKAADLTLFFTFEGGVVPHYVIQCILARCLRDQGHETAILLCDGLFERCPVFDMRYLPYDASPEDKAPICAGCAAEARHLSSLYGIRGIPVRDHFGPTEERRVVQTLAALPHDLETFSFDGIPFGKAVIMDMALATKRFSFEPDDPAIRAMWTQYLATALRGYLLASRLLDELPVRRTLRFNDYTVLLGSHFASLRRGIPAYHVTQPPHLGVNRRNVVIFPHVWPKCFDDNVADWPLWRDLALPEEAVDEIGDDILDRLRGQGYHTFSPSKAATQEGLLERLGLSGDKPILAAFTSSLDERNADVQNRLATAVPTVDAPQPFADQISWLKALTGYVERSGALQLVVRIHPREGANKRDAIVSEHYALLRATFDKPYAACRFVWPEDDVSSYDIGELADLVLTSTSTIGLEFARMGACNLASVRGVNYPLHSDVFRVVAATAEEYFATIPRLLETPADLSRVLYAFRYYHATRMGISLDLGDVIRDNALSPPPAYRTPREAEAIAAVIVEGRGITELNRKRLRERQGSELVRREREAVRRQLARVLHFVLTNEDLREPLTPVVKAVSDDADGEALCEELARRHPDRMTVVVAGRTVHHSHQGRSGVRRSPLCVRLAVLCKEPE